jgi:hypothetical protein
MTKEEAIKEIEKAFEPAFANYIITALTEGATVSDKESFKPMIEIDLYSVIKQKYIEREVLDKITEIIAPLRHLSIDEMSGIEWDILRVIDKCKEESEVKANGNEK